MHRGKLVILTIGLLAIGLAAVAWLLRWREGQRAHAFWGVETAVRIRHDAAFFAARVRPAPDQAAAPPVEVAARVGATPGGDAAPRVGVVEVGGRRWLVEPSTDLTNALGWVHARHNLIQDHSFAWNTPADARGGSWDYALLFHRAPHHETLLIDVTGRRLHWLETGKTLGLAPHTGASWRKYLESQLPSQSPAVRDGPSPQSK